MLERLAKDKHYSSLQKSINYGGKKFYSTGPRAGQRSVARDYYKFSVTKSCRSAQKSAFLEKKHIFVSFACEQG
jgi:hypothetical protein